MVALRNQSQIYMTRYHLLMKHLRVVEVHIHYSPVFTTGMLLLRPSIIFFKFKKEIPESLVTLCFY